MGTVAHADKLLKHAVKRTHATIKKQDNRGRKHFVAWTVNRLLEEYMDPRAILLEIASTDTATLAETMGITPGDALAERRLCAQAVLPYVAQKLPVQVDMRHTKAIHLNIVDERQFTELLNLADTDALDPNDQVQLVQGLVIDNDTPAHTTANGLQLTTDALPHAEHLTAAATSDDAEGDGRGVAPSVPAPTTRQQDGGSHNSDG